MPNHHVPTNAVAQILRSILSPIRQFLQLEAAGGIVLLVVTVFTLIWANSTYGDVYFHLLHLPIGFQFGPFILQKSLQHWVNDGLMVIFFFVVGLEIKKEFIAGELSDLKRAALPIVGALGGMVAPALIYAAFNVGTDTAHGWGIPMATDIAFAVGVLTLLGKRVPFSLLVFLLALAIADDLGAVLVIAFFYTADLSIVSLGYAALAAGATLFLQQAGVRSRFVYFLLAIVLWYAILKSGVHATVAGVILGFMTPIRAFIDPDTLRRAGFDLLKTAGPEQIAELRAIAHESLSPADAWIRLLHPWVSFVIMPIFALTNAGVRLEGFDLEAFWAAPVSLGVFLGLFLGKPIGIFGLSWLSCKLGLAEKPRGASWAQMLGVAAIGGIGFTMALFVSHLSIADSAYADFSKLAILLASLSAAALGSLILVFKGAR